jgi:adenosine deaminase
VAHLVRDRRVPLELCPTSNVHSGAAKSIEEHPIGLLMDLRFRVTVNTDNRLMSATSLSQEFLQLVDAFEIGWGQIGRLTTNAMKSAFIPFDERLEILERVIWPAYAELRDA